MLTKEFFTGALTSTQKTEIEACVAAGKTYVG
jgi:ABC-type arginine/histidine transport system permease subunit